MDCSVVARPLGGCFLNCSGHGFCVNRTCECDPGFSGLWCQRMAVSESLVANNNSSGGLEKTCPGGCSGHGSCQQGKCLCDPLYTGSACKSVLISVLMACPGAFGDCSGHGSCVNGTCICDALWGSLDCSVEAICPSTGSHNETCHIQGLCSNGTAWDGSGCSAETCPTDCTHHGVCINGTCLCDPGWTGPSCTSMSCPRGCSGQGACAAVGKGAAPVCICDAGWTGSDCSVRLCPTSETGSSCSGHGGCTQNGTCICYGGWAGEDCSVLVDCSSRGQRKCGSCVCVEGFGGEECELDLCQDSRIYSPSHPTDHTLSRVCSDNGRCTTSGGCVCAPGWAGPRCSDRATCLRNCSGHGTCAGSRDSGGICTCAVYKLPGIPFDTPRFSGEDCSVEHCPGWINGKECSGRGSCQQSGGENVCDCFLNPGDNMRYSGPGCNRPPQFFLQRISPAVGPLEGGTVITIVGPGVELLLSEYPGDVYCSFGGIAATAAYLGSFPDNIVCTSPQTSLGGVVSLVMLSRSNQTLRNTKTGLPAVSNQLQFLYFAQTRVLGISPTFAPIRPTGPRRWIGPWDAYGPNKDGTNVITVSGTYFPPGGTYTCRFGDCDGQKATRIDAVTLACTMPIMATASQMNIFVSSNGQQYSNTEGKASAFTSWSILSISPVCGDFLGSTQLTVFGQYLTDSSDITRDPARFFCRFGRPTSTGQTMIPNSLSKKVFAFYSKATVSTAIPGALVCPVPNWPVEEDDFALSLDAVCGVGDCNPQQMDGYYVGQWDAVDSILSSASYGLGAGNIPRGVKFSTYYHPQVAVRGLNLPVIFPSIGPASGGTKITVTGYGFNYPRYGPLTPNDQFTQWTPEQLNFDDGAPRCSVLGQPEYNVQNSEYKSSPAGCLFSGILSTGITFVSDSVVVCISPPMDDPTTSVRDVVLEIALDGQTFTSNGFLFQYVAPPSVWRVIPTVGVTGGGTPITVEGKNLVESGEFSNTGSINVIVCVFILNNGTRTTTSAVSLGFCRETTQSGCTAVACVTPFVEQEQKILIDISISGQIQDSQLTGSRIEFFMFTNPTISFVNPTLGIADSINNIDRRVAILLDINDFALPLLSSSSLTKTTLCLFGEKQVAGVLEILTGGTQLVCIAPKVDSAKTVTLNITFNGLDWTSSDTFYSYFTNPGTLLPSTGPVTGGTLSTFSVDTGSLQAVTFEFRFGNLFVNSNFPANSVVSPFINTAGPVPVYLRIRTAISDSNWIQTSSIFIYYDVHQAISSLLPCTSTHLTQTDCRHLDIPKNGQAYPINLFVDVPLLGINKELILNLKTVKCGFWPHPLSLAAEFMESCGSFVFEQTTNITVLRCNAPSILQVNPNGTAYFRISLNGQDYENTRFEISFKNSPLTTRLSPSSGLISGGMKISVHTSFPTNQISFGFIQSYSCLFYDKNSKHMRFVPVDNFTCDSPTNNCTAICTTPDFSSSTSDTTCLLFDVFLSINRRDPCFSDDCEQSCTDTGCSCVDLNKSISTFYQSTNSWCSPCGELTCNSECQSQGSPFQYYGAPELLGLSPRTIGGSRMRGQNQSVMMTLFGNFGSCTSGVDARILAIFVDGDREIKFEVGNVSVTAYKVSFQLPIPCAKYSVNPECEAHFGLDPNFKQESEVMTVQFQLSFNGGLQYSLSEYTLKVLLLESICPSYGCGHGSCLSFAPGNAAPMSNLCICGYWGQPEVESKPVCGISNGTLATTDGCRCSSNDPSFPRATCPVSCSSPQNSSSFGAKESWFCSKQAVQDTISGLNDQLELFTYGPEHWPDGYRKFSMDCSASPTVIALTPSVGVIEGGTMVQITLRIVDFAAEFSNVIEILHFVTCDFDGIKHSPAILNTTRLISGEVDLVCVSPMYTQLDEQNISVKIRVTFQNSLGVASPLAFPVLHSVSSTFLYVFRPFIENVFLWRCSLETCAKVNDTLSAPVCSGGCDALADMYFVIEGSNFEDVGDLVCCYTQNNECPGQIGSSATLSGGDTYRSFLAHGVYVSSSMIRCPLVVDESSAGYYHISVSLNKQEYSVILDSSPVIFFYASPLGLNNVKSIHNGIERTISYGVVSREFKFYKLAPTSGGSPVSVYLSEPCTGSKCTSASSVLSSFQGRSRIRFVSCSKPKSIINCQCSSFPSFDSDTDIVGIGQTYTIDGAFHFVHQFVGITPDVSTAGAGQYLMCFAVNGVHFLPIRPTDRTQLAPFVFLFYLPPLISGLLPSSGIFSTDTFISATESYEVVITGENFISGLDSIFISLCYSNSMSGTLCPFDENQVESSWAIVLSPSKISLRLWGIVPLNITSVNISLSFNSYDFTPMRRGMTEFRFFRLPKITSIFPVWGLYGYETTITIKGGAFENLPFQSFCIFSRCYNSEACDQSVGPIILRPITFLSSTSVSCNTPSKPPMLNPADSDTSMIMYVTFTPDGRDLTLNGIGSTQTTLGDGLSLTGGANFSFTSDLRKQLRVSSNNLATVGGILNISVTDQYWCSVASSTCSTCMRIDLINSFVVGLIPSSSELQHLGVIRALLMFKILEQNISSAGTQSRCRITISAAFPALPFPFVGDLQVSFDGGQRFTGPASSILVYRQLPPTKVYPARASRSSLSRPNAFVYFSGDMLKTTGPPISQTQAAAGFSPSLQACSTCYIGPQCIFKDSQDVITSQAVFQYDQSTPYLVCQVPLYLKAKTLTILISFDGSIYFSSNVSSIFVYEEPFVNDLFPNVGMWASKTPLVLLGSNFLGPGTAWHQTWCIFDFQDLLPVTDQWAAAPRMWSKAYPFCDSTECLNISAVTCTLPAIGPAARPELPRYPRARVGLIVDGHCALTSPSGDCLVLKNSESRGNLLSNAFVVYSDIPVITAISPEAGLANVPVEITVFGSLFVNEYHWGPPRGIDGTQWTPQSKITQRLCKNPPSGCQVTVQRFPCPGLTCKFGRLCSCPAARCVDWIGNVSAIYSSTSPNQVICPVPRQVGNSTQAVLNLSISLNGESFEYSNSIQFRYINLRLTASFPTHGSSMGGGLVYVWGDGFANITCTSSNEWACLHCRFQQLSKVAGQLSNTVRVPAVFINSTLLTCIAPSATDFNMQWWNGEPGKMPPTCGDQCVLTISVSFAPNDPGISGPQLRYSWTNALLFHDIGVNASTVAGNVSVYVYADNLVDGSQNQVLCRFGSKVVRADNMSESIASGFVVCQAPPMDAPGPVDFSLSTNGVDFCYLVRRESSSSCVRERRRLVKQDGSVSLTSNFVVGQPLCDCVLTSAMKGSNVAQLQQFVFHEEPNILEINPPSGISSGGTELIFSGLGFKSYGQKFYVYFGNPPAIEGQADQRVSVPAQILNDSFIRCFAPALPKVKRTDDNGVSYNIFFEDVAAPVQISSNGFQYSVLRDGSDCVQRPDAISTDNKKANCSGPFVMYTWFAQPLITAVKPIPSNLYENLDAAQYAQLIGFPALPQGPTSGGTEVTLTGDYFVSLARAEVINGAQSQVECNLVDGTVPYGQSCSTTCNFPFAVKAGGSTSYEYNYGCVNLKWQASQISQQYYWCSVGGGSPATYTGAYGICRNDISVWRDYNQGGKVVTSLECRFGNIHVPAQIIQSPQILSNPVLNRTVICISPPYEYGVAVPLSLTFNRKDYSLITPNTFFQYLKPSPVPISLGMDKIMTYLVIQFDVETNMGGQTMMNEVPCRTLQLFADGLGVDGATTSFLQMAADDPNPTMCMWTDRSRITIFLAGDVTFMNGSRIHFKNLPCDEPSGVCWHWKSFENRGGKKSSELLVRETNKVGCKYIQIPSLAGNTTTHDCNQSVQHSYDMSWCGHCLQSDDDIVELSYPFNRSAEPLTIVLSNFEFPSPLPVISGPSSVDSCQKRCLLGINYGAVCVRDSDCNNGLSGGLCKTALVQLDARKSMYNLGKPFKMIRWSLDKKYSGQFVEPGLNSLVYYQENMTNAAAEKILNPTFFPREADVVYGMQYCFHLSLTNWVGVEAITSSCFQVHQSNKIPCPQISMQDGNTQISTKIYFDVVMSAEVIPSPCSAGMPFPITFWWSVFPSVPGWDSIGLALSESRLVLKAFSLPFVPGQTYVFTLNATMNVSGFLPDTPLQSSVFNVPKIFEHSEPVIKVSGGTVRTVSVANGPLIVDASETYDPDVPLEQRSNSNLCFCWNCVLSNASDCGWTSWLIDSPNSILTVPASYLATNTIYLIQIIVSRDMGISVCQTLNASNLSGAASHKIQVQVTAQTVPLITILTPPSLTVSTSTTLRLDALVNLVGASSTPACSAQYSWNIIPEISQQLPSGYACGLVELVIPTKHFPSAATTSYTIQLTVSHSSMHATASISVKTNFPPKMGGFAVTPSSGKAMKTVFHLVTYGWVDIPEALPLTYSYSFSVGGNDALDMLLSPWTTRPLLDLSLPSGDPSLNFSALISVEVQNAFGVVAPYMSQMIYCLLDDASPDETLAELSSAASLLLSSPKDELTFGKLGLIMRHLTQSRSAATPGYWRSLQDMREKMVEAIVGQLKTKQNRRSGDDGRCANNQDASSFGSAVDALKVMTDITSPDSPTVGTCITILDFITCYLKSGNDLAQSEQDYFKTSAGAFAALHNCIDYLPNHTSFLPTFRALSIASMKFVGSAELPMTFARGGTTVSAKRRKVSDGLVALALSGIVNVTIPSNLRLNLPDDSLVDVYAVLIDSSRYKLQFGFEQTVYGYVVDVSIHPAYLARSPVSQQVAAAKLANISDLTIENLPDAVNITFPVVKRPPTNLDNSNGVFQATVCGFYNETAMKWVPFGPNFVVASSNSMEMTSSLVCSTPHLTGFVSMPSLVGCDLVASTTPIQRDACCLCAGVGVSCCDWRRISSANNVAKDYPCTLPYGQLDKCLVCNGQNKSFITLAMKNVSGICDYRGVPCSKGLIPNACGVCELPEKEQLRVQSQGLCDCSTNPKLPTEPGGGLVVDRCGICNGNNASMDDCGSNGLIPASDANGLFQVCHGGGRGSVQVPRWNLACRGCDNVSRPDLPFLAARRPFPGGVQKDVCGFCGGNGSTCPGCDGIAGSTAVLDACRVCGGKNDSCLGCDGSRTPLIKITDGCHVCGGEHYGACSVSYNFSFTQSLTLSQFLGFDLSPGRDQRFKVRL